MNEQTNTSAYASAESSPNSSLTPSSTSFQVNLESLNQIESSEIMMNQQSTKSIVTGGGGGLLNSYSTHSLLNAGLSSNNMNEFQSLPPAQSTQSLNQNSNNSTVKSIIGNVVKSSLTDLSPKKQAQQQQQQQTPQSPSRSSAVMSFFGKMLNKKSTNIASSNNDNNKTTVSAAGATTTLSSTSSPNPECSPYKFLQTEIQLETTITTNTDSSKNAQQQTQQQYPAPLSPNRLSTANRLGTLSPNGTTINDAVAIFNAATQIEKLASLNHKEHEQADPILTTSSSSSSDNLSCDNNHPSVPLSSEQFCNDLNVKLASQVAANSLAPIVVQTFNNNNNTKTSNDTTSSIHNDLKMILEESKEKNKVKKMLISENSETTSNLKKLLQKAKSREHLIELLNEMNYVNNNNNKLSYTKEFLEKIRMERHFLIEKELIPEKFKQFDICMIYNTNQKNKTCYWDPERYFDMIQYPNKLNTSSSKQHNQRQKHNNSNNKMQRTSNYTNDDMFDSPQPLQVPKNSPKSVQSQKGQQNYGKKTSQNENLGHKLLDMLKNKNNLEYNEEHSNQNNSNNNILDMLHQKKTTTTTTTTPKNVKNQQTNHTSSNNQENLLNEILNFKKTSMVQQKQQQNHHQLQQQQQQPRHFPQILTVQELEMSQISQQQNSILPSNNNNNNNVNQKANKRSKNNRCSVGGGSSQNTSSCSSTSSTISSCNSNEYNLMNVLNSNQNSSDAYKQLVKNLSNHPLSTPPTANQLSSHTNQRISSNPINPELLYKLQTQIQNNNNNNKIPLVLNQNQQLEQQRVSDTKMLKQLLNLNKSKETNKQHKKKHHHSSHHNKNNDFPTVNPHERPFQSILPDSCIQMPTNHIENLLIKMNQQQQQQQQNSTNFSDLLNKLTINNNNINSQTMAQQKLETLLLNSQQQQQQQQSNDILKWFNGAINNQNLVAKQTQFDILKNLY